MEQLLQNPQFRQAFGGLMQQMRNTDEMFAAEAEKQQKMTTDLYGELMSDMMGVGSNGQKMPEEVQQIAAILCSNPALIKPVQDFLTLAQQRIQEAWKRELDNLSKSFTPPPSTTDDEQPPLTG